LIHARATDSDIVEHISTAETVKAFRITTSAIGDGFVEALPTTRCKTTSPHSQRANVEH
jgi:hypothetical protein